MSKINQVSPVVKQEQHQADLEALADKWLAAGKTVDDARRLGKLAKAEAEHKARMQKIMDGEDSS